MTSDLLPGLFGTEAAAARALVTLLEVERQLLHNFRLARVGDSQRRKISAYVGSEVRHFRNPPPAASQRGRRSNSCAVPTASFGPRESACSIFAGVVLMFPPTDRQ